MEKQFELLKVTRNNVLNELEACATAQLFEIPAGYHNHILWNALHVIATQQVLVYGLTQTPFRIDQHIVDTYKKGTTPSEETDEAMVAFAKEHLLATIDQMQEDYQQKVFGPCAGVTTSYGATLTTVEDAITFLNLHESMHYGQIKMLRMLVSNGK